MFISIFLSGILLFSVSVLFSALNIQHKSAFREISAAIELLSCIISLLGGSQQQSGATFGTSHGTSAYYFACITIMA